MKRVTKNQVVDLLERISELHADGQIDLKCDKADELMADIDEVLDKNYEFKEINIEACITQLTLPAGTTPNDIEFDVYLDGQELKLDWLEVTGWCD